MQRTLQSIDVFSVDIEKAFLQIILDESHSDFVRFLHLKELDDLCTAKINDPENIAVYRIGRVLLGYLSSSPLLLSGTIIHHAHSYASFYPESDLHFIKSSHVDD